MKAYDLFSLFLTKKKINLILGMFHTGLFLPRYGPKRVIYEKVSLIFSELQHYKINKLLILIEFLDIWYWILAKKIKVQSFESVTAFGNAAVSAIVKFSRGTFFAELGFFLFKVFCVVQQRQLNIGITILSFFLFFLEIRVG